MLKKANILLIILSVIIIGVSACDGKSTTKKENDNKETTLNYHVHMDENGETHIHKNSDHKDEFKTKSKTENKNSKKTAEKTKPLAHSQDAVEIIQKFSAKELGLEGELSDYHFLVSTKKMKIKGKSYLEVIASKMKNQKKKTVNIVTKGTYYVSADMKRFLKKDMKSGKITTLK